MSGYDDDSDNHAPNDNNPSDSDNSNPKLTSFTLSGKVIIGVGLIIFSAAAATLYTTMWSISPQIRTVPANNIFGTNLMALGSKLQSPSAQVNSGLSTSAAAAATPHIDKRFLLVQGDFTWNHTSPGPTIKVGKGDRVQIIIVNAGHMAHNFGIGKLSEKANNILTNINSLPLEERVSKIPYDDLSQMSCPDCQLKFKDGQIERFMSPETQAVVTFTANESGHFKYFCVVRGHIWLGMIGDFVVEEKSGAAGSSDNTQQAAGVGGGKTG